MNADPSCEHINLIIPFDHRVFGDCSQAILTSMIMAFGAKDDRVIWDTLQGIEEDLMSEFPVYGRSEYIVNELTRLSDLITDHYDNLNNILSSQTNLLETAWPIEISDFDGDTLIVMEIHYE